MAAIEEAVRAFVLLAGWPLLVGASVWMMQQAMAFRRRVGQAAASSLVVTSMASWLVTSALLGIVATATLFLVPGSTWYVMAVFVAWAALLVVMLRVAKGWGVEARLARAYYADTGRVERLKADIINRFSHAFATPLTPMASQLAVLRGEYHGQLSPGQRRAVDMMARNQARLTRMVGQAILAGQVHGGQIRLARAPADLALILEDAVARAEPGHNIRVSRIERLEAAVDVDRLAYVLDQVLMHALERTKDDVEVWLHAERDDALFGLRYTSDEDLKAAFGLLEESAMDVSSGDPLQFGLFTAQGIVELHGGHVEAGRQGASVVASLRIPMVQESTSPTLAIKE